MTVFACTYLWMHPHIYLICMHEDMHDSVHMYVCMHVDRHAWLFAFLYQSYMHVCMYVCIYVDIHLSECMCVWMYTYHRVTRLSGHIDPKFLHKSTKTQSTAISNWYVTTMYAPITNMPFKHNVCTTSANYFMYRYDTIMSIHMPYIYSLQS